MIELRGNREGVSLVELMVAVMLVGVVVTSLGGLSFQAARQSVVLAGDGYLQGVVTQEVNRLQAVPFTQLTAGTACTSVNTGSFPHTRCHSVAVTTPTVRTITLTVTPGQARVRPVTVTITRFQPTNYNPLGWP